MSAIDGKTLYSNYTAQITAPVNSVERDYARTLITARAVVGEDRLYAALEEAEQTGKRIGLVEVVSGVYGEPTDIELI